ncbi:hypothetical protein GRAN_2956 [Granulicella sibirica]|uniref:Uncharacterized protein n=1 Tax=Granulicella sibirica TaxID=2479048 RepID=A0A4Q0T2F8_9BACT|nr:hypothetical protein GRAN_2956 [Granulicella sibirica]
MQLMESAVLELALANQEGVTNSDVSHALGLQSDYLGGSRITSAGAFSAFLCVKAE